MSWRFRSGDRVRVLRAAVVGLALTTSVVTDALGQGTAAALAGKAHIQISAGPAGQALKQFADQTGIQLLFDFEAVKNLQTQAVNGELGASEALKLMLAGTTLTFEFVNEKTVTVTARSKRTAGLAEGTAQDVGTSVGRGHENLEMAQTGASPGSGQGETGNEDKKQNIEEIVVTATKRAERAQDVPMSIAAIGSQDIERRGLTGMGDYLRTIPGVSQFDSANGVNVIVIRGITTNPGVSENFSAGATVSSYFGETSITGAAGPYGGGIDVRPVDLERIEVLRGPQGTTFGDASLGGTMRLIPKKPVLGQFEANASANYSNTAGDGSGNSMIQGAVNIPVVGDRLAVRAVGYRYDDSGFYRNIVGSDPASLANAQNWNIANQVNGYIRNDVGRTVSVGGRLAGLWRATDKLEVSATILKQRTEQDGITFATLGAGSYDQTLYPIAPLARERGETGDVNDTDMTLENLLANYDFGWSTLTASASYIDSGLTFANDVSRVFSQPYSNNNHSIFRSGMGETRLTSHLAGRMQFLAGLFYQKFSSNVHQIGWSPGPPARNIYGTNPIAIIDLDRDVDQRAAFGEVSYKLTEKLTATVGARFFKYGRDEFQARQGGVYGTALGSPNVVTLSSDERSSTKKASLSYKPWQDTLLYALWSQGFRLGHPQSGLRPFANVCDANHDGLVDGTDVSIDSSTEVKSDSLDNYELGGKASLFNRRLVIDSAVYHIKWRDLPVSSSVTCGNTMFSGFLINAGTATSNGIELQTQVSPARGWKIDLGAGYTKTELDQTTSLGPKGSRLPGSPEVNANLGAEYDFNAAGHEAFVRLDSFYTGKFYSFAALGDTAPPGSAAGDYLKLDARAGVAIRDLGFEVFVRNLTNENAATLVQQGSPLLYTRLQPRTVGVQLSYHF